MVSRASLIQQVIKTGVYYRVVGKKKVTGRLKLFAFEVQRSSQNIMTSGANSNSNRYTFVSFLKPKFNCQRYEKDILLHFIGCPNI